MPTSKRRLERNKLSRVLDKLERGEIPILRSYIPGIEKVLKSYGLKPGVDLYVPDIDWVYMSASERAEVRANFRKRKYYRKGVELTGAEYKSREQRRKEALANKLRQKLKANPNLRQHTLRRLAKTQNLEQGDDE